MKRYRSWLLVLLWLPFAVVFAEEERFDEGIDYAVVTPAMPVDSVQGVQVTELFWYGCPHCFQFEFYLSEWRENKPEGVVLTRVPAILNNPRWRLHAQAFYTAEVLGVLDKVHEPLFNAMHRQKRRLDTPEQLEAFFTEQGVDPEAFRTAFNSFAVQAKANRAVDLTKRSGIEGVPAVVVAGKYRVDGPMAGSYRRLIEIVNYLIAKEQQASAGNR